MDKLTQALARDAVLKRLADFSARRRVKIWLVGGFLRDLLLKRSLKRPPDKKIDIDIAMKKGSIKFAGLFADRIKGSFVLLDKQRGCARIVLKRKTKIYELDFADFRAQTLEKDLAKRDFTINSIALDIMKLKDKADIRNSLIDVCGGLSDIESGTIRVTGADVFEEDPLRVIRAFSLSCRFGFKIDGLTVNLAKQSVFRLDEVSGERMWEELSGLLSQDDCYALIEKMDRIGILERFFPQSRFASTTYQGPYHHLDVWRHSLESLKQLEILLADKRLLLPDVAGGLKRYLKSEVRAGRSRKCLLKLAALLHDLGKPATKKIDEDGKVRFTGHEKAGVEISEEIADRLKLSRAESDFLNLVIMHHLRPGYLADQKTVTKRAVFRFFRDTKDTAPAILLLSIADKWATKGPLSIEPSRQHQENLALRLIKEYFKSRQKIAKLPKLVNGRDIIKELDIEPGPKVGKILQEIQELQAEGKIKTRQQAVKWIRKKGRRWSKGPRIY